MKTILIADDEPNIRTSLGTAFRLEGYRVEAAEDGPQALAAVEAGEIDLVVLDLQMPGMDGLEVLRELRRRGHQVPVMILTAHGTIDKAVEATRLGAFDFVEKPPRSDRILLTARNALHQARLEEENRELRGEAERRYDMIGASPPMQRLYEQIRRTAPTQARVLITGENGTGKELIARALHRHSSRSDGPFVPVNCAAIPRDLFESELFGHEKGAFTGATARRTGKFLRAHGGTLFLDEVADMPLETQGKILRVLLDQTFERVGGSIKVQVDVRVVSATSHNLDQAIAAGRFRQDLLHRLNVVPLAVPALRERRDDVPVLARYFMRREAEAQGLTPREISPDAMAALQAADWPGNVRELRNVIARLLILAPDSVHAVIGADRLPAELSGAAPSILRYDNSREIMSLPLRDAREIFEREYLMAQITRFGGNISRTAAFVGMERSALHRKLKLLRVHGGERLSDTGD